MKALNAAVVLPPRPPKNFLESTSRVEEGKKKTIGEEAADIGSRSNLSLMG